MKKRTGIIVLSVLAVIIIAYFPVKKIVGKNDFMSEWGRVLSDDSKEKADNTNKQDGCNYKISSVGLSSKTIISSDDIFEAGTDVLITNQELKIAKAFYILQGQSENKAEKAAVKYVEQYNAMYVEAVDNDFDVTEKEIDDYTSEFKTMAAQSGNSFDIEKVIAQFDSEDEYWNYQKIVLQKQLPIQKYIQSLEQDYRINIGNDDDNNDDTVLWDEKLVKMQEEAVKKQQYKKIDNLNMIDKKFEV